MSLADGFNRNAKPPPRNKHEARNGGQKTRPFSIRLTEDERRQLEATAGSVPIGAYVRQRLLSETRQRRPTRSPVVIGIRWRSPKAVQETRTILDSRQRTAPGPE
jgi:hypothetical protein